jgi:ribonucleoside-diphosphate reductase alpha chain
MVQGHDYIKMSTSVIDYIFRDLAISYLKRTDLGQVKPEDLLATGTQEKSIEKSAEKSIDKHINKPTEDPLKADGKTSKTQTKPEAAKETPEKKTEPRKDSARQDSHRHDAALSKDSACNISKQEEAQRMARIKGYEGDPCPNCGSLTLVRNGTCMKCDTCGGTTGCS